MSSQTLGDFIKVTREKNEHTQYSLAKAVGCTDAYISKLENGLVIPSFKMVIALAKALCLPSSELIKHLPEAQREEYQLVLQDFSKGLADELAESVRVKGQSSQPATRQLYLLGSVPAGPIQPTADYVEGIVTVDYSVVGNQECFALRVKGNCLEDKGIFNGDIVIVARNVQPENGKIAVIRIHDHGETQVTMKIWHRTNDQVILTSANKSLDQAPIVINKHDKKPVDVIGKVIYSYKDLR